LRTAVVTLSRKGLQVTIDVPTKKENAGEKAKTVARQKGSKACKSCRKQQPLQSNTSAEEQEPEGD
jgi:hypothetical protein